MELMWCAFGVLLVFMLLAIKSNNAAYHNGFWDGVLWERSREGRVHPPHSCKAKIYVKCDLYRPGTESLYPSKPGPSWPQWRDLAAGAERRAERCTCAKYRRCPTHGDL